MINLSRTLEKTAAISCFAVFLLITVSFLWKILSLGLGSIDLGFVIDPPTAGGLKGGILPILFSTLAIVLVASLVSFPLSFGTASYLTEYSYTNTALYRRVRMSLEILSGVPSVVFGLFGYLFFGVWLGLGYSILTGGLTLACMILPLLTTSIEHSLQQVPNNLRQTSWALGISKYRTLLLVLFPCAKKGIASGFLLSLSRALAETAALLFTSGYAMRMPNTFMDPGRSLSVHIFDLSMNVPGGSARAFATAIILIGLIASAHIITALCVKSPIQKV